MNNIIDKLAWLYLENNQLLVVRSKGKTLFYLPGGKREQGESDHQALIREIKEEISVDLLPESITYAEKFIAQADGKSDQINVKLSCYYGQYVGQLIADAEIEEIKFVSYQDKRCCSKATILVLDWLKERMLIN